MSKMLEKAAHCDVRNEPLAFQLGARGGRNVVGAEPLRDGRALVGETVRRADGVGHDLGRDRANVVVGHLRCLRWAGHPATAALAAVGHRSLQLVGRCRRCCRRLCHRRRRCHSSLTRLGHRRRTRPNPLGLPRRHLPRPLCCHQPRRLYHRLLLRLTLGLLLCLQQPVALGPRLHAHAALLHLAWRRRVIARTRRRHEL
mmetsp:Transcript_66673/g.160973  ORF Transcript_66673/g.160973 Transcript_66673/m.160973 type:complete len:200 (+) Transcript_66673:316-915(+)